MSNDPEYSHSWLISIQGLNLLVSISGQPNVTVNFMPGSKHQVIMFIGDMNVNEELIKQKLALPVQVRRKHRKIK